MNTILVVDNEALLLEWLAEILAGAGFQVQTAASGRAAVACYSAKPADLVILDAYMPDMDGFETLRTLRARNPLVKAIGISGLSSNLSPLCLQMMSKLGASAILQKPFTSADLLATVGKILLPQGGLAARDRMEGNASERVQVQLPT